MKLIDREIVCKGRSDVFSIYPIGDAHIGARNCAEKPLRKQVKEIYDNPNALWFDGGDTLEAIKPQDSKRWDYDVLPDWMLEGDAMNVREKLNDILRQQYERAIDIFDPIATKCLGKIEGNHEYTIRKYYNDNVQAALCRKLNIADLTDETVIRLRFKRGIAKATVKIYARHGYGGGRTPGAEPNKLARMLTEFKVLADVMLSGHTHTHDVLPPDPTLWIPNSGKLPKELYVKYCYAGNWGCWLYSHVVGPGSYASRACYPARAMSTIRVDIKPFAQVYQNGQQINQPHIELRTITI